MKLSVFIAISLDGYIARENGDIDWLPEPEKGINGEDYGYRRFFAPMNVLVMGRKTYEKALEFGSWPYEKKRVIVLAHKNINIPEQLQGKVEKKICSPLELYEELEKENVKEVYVDGGKTIQGFLNAGLINEMTISRIPILIGRGIPLFGDMDKDLKLRHLETRSFDNGIVQSKYEVIY